MNLTLAAAWFALGKLTSKQAIAAASDALDAGVYSASLGQLMSEDPEGLSAVVVFGNALEELGIPVPSRSVALRVVARDYAQKIVTGVLTAYEGARRIWWNVAIEPDADPSLRGFIGLASQWEDDPAYQAGLAVDILDEARQLLAENLDS